MSRWFWGVLLCCILGMVSREAEAKDARFALLVGNEQGWKGDPRLRYAIRGDLLPMAERLRQVGFRVKVLRNPNAAQVRAILAKIQRRARQQKDNITTFLFYYSGHADRKYFHMGPSKKKPLSYKEFVGFLRKLPVQRRIAFFDACFSGEIIRQFGSLTRYKEMVRKGARGYQPVDISKTIFHRGDESGLQVISSSLDYSWESKRYKASVFTHHLLRGLQGPADRDRDGKISVNELFNFVSDQMVRDIRQKPQMFGVIQRSRAYALAPAYQSQLHIDSNVVGTLHVSVANFVWKQKKQRRRPLRLSVVHGWGTVELRKGNQCWQQRVFLPKGGAGRLAREWVTRPCRLLATQRKGTVTLPAQVAESPSQNSLNLEISGGIWSSALAGAMPMVGGEIGLRWTYVSVFLEAWGNQHSFLNQRPSQLLSGLRVEGGYAHSWGAWQLFAGGYVGASLLFQDLGQPERLGLLFRYGLSVVPRFQINERWGMTLRAQVGFAVGSFGGVLQNILDGGVRLGLLYRL